MLFDEVMLVFDFELVGEVLQVIKGLVVEGMIMLLVIYEMCFVYDVLFCVIFMNQGVICEEGNLCDMFVWFCIEWLVEFLKSLSFN